MKKWILILKIILALTGMAILGWFIGSIIAIKMECGGVNVKEAEVEKILNDSFTELEKNIESADLSKETINALVELMYECINTAHGKISDEIKSERVMQKFTAIDLEDILKENYVNKNKIREIMITNTNKLNKSVNEILKRIYKARIELCKELLKGDD